MHGSGILVVTNVLLLSCILYMTLYNPQAFSLWRWAAMQCRLCASNDACPDMLQVVLVYGDILYVHTLTRLRNEKCHINHGHINHAKRL